MKANMLLIRGLLLAIIMAVATAVTMAALIRPAGAETKLTDFNGSWHGHGTDRNTPFESRQDTRCRAAISATVTKMNTAITCNGASDLNKAIHLDIVLSGNAFTGTLKRVTRPNAPAMDDDGARR